MQKFYKQNGLVYEVSITRLEIIEDNGYNSFSYAPVPGAGKNNDRVIGRLNPEVDKLHFNF